MPALFSAEDKTFEVREQAHSKHEANLYSQYLETLVVRDVCWNGHSRKVQLVVCGSPVSTSDGDGQQSIDNQTIRDAWELNLLFSSQDRVVFLG